MSCVRLTRNELADLRPADGGDDGLRGGRRPRGWAQAARPGGRGFRQLRGGGRRRIAAGPVAGPEPDFLAGPAQLSDREPGGRGTDLDLHLPMAGSRSVSQLRGCVRPGPFHDQRDPDCARDGTERADLPGDGGDHGGGGRVVPGSALRGNPHYLQKRRALCECGVAGWGGVFSRGKMGSGPPAERVGGGRHGRGAALGGVAAGVAAAGAEAEEFQVNPRLGTIEERIVSLWKGTGGR